MSTITLQHICVYDIRFNYLKEFYRVLKPGGLLSIQMGYGEGKAGAVDYYCNNYDATSTNSNCDTMVTDVEQPINDLGKIGFKDIQVFVRPSYSDKHPQWIYCKATK